jgi:hypothetical protein
MTPDFKVIGYKNELKVSEDEEIDTYDVEQVMKRVSLGKRPLRQRLEDSF